MNIFKRISIQNFRKNKKRSISTIIGIVLSTALLCATCTLGVSIRKTLVDNAIYNTGYYHVKMDNPSKEKQKVIELNRDIQDLFYVSEEGYGILPNCKNENKPYVHLYSLDKTTMEKINFKLVQGRMPENAGEIVIGNHITYNGGVNLKVGDIVTFEIGTRKDLDGTPLKSQQSFLKEEETLEVKKTYMFKVVGKMERPSVTFEEYQDAGYTIFTTGLEGDRKIAFLTLKDPKNYKTTLPEILGAKNYEELQNNTAGYLGFEDWKINKELLRWEAFAFSDDTVQMIYNVISFVLLIIIVTSIFCIRNAFAISVTEKKQMYGMLASVGATKKQIRKIVRKEANLLAGIGIILGLASGIFAAYVLIRIINLFAGEYLFASRQGLSFGVSAPLIVLSAVLAYLTVYVSAWEAGRRAGKASPIDNVKKTESLRIKHLKTPWWVKKIFGVGGILAYKNLKRSRKRYRTTVVSLTVSIFLFLSMNSFFNYMFITSLKYYEEKDYNIEITSGLGELSQNDIEKICSMKNVEHAYQILQGPSLELENKNNVNPGFSKYLRENDVEPQGMSVVIMALTEDEFKAYCKELGVSFDSVKKQGILIDDYWIWDGEKEISTRIYTYEKGQTINGTFPEENQPYSISIGHIATKRPNALENSYSVGGYLVVDKEQFKDLNFIMDNIFLDSSDPNKTEGELKKNYADLIVDNLYTAVKNIQVTCYIFQIFLYGFITVITLIGVTNVFNTITSNMELRQKEFAMLKSIGMTSKEFHRMICLETVFYGSKSWVLGVISGTIASYIIYKIFVNPGDPLVLPFKAMLLSGVFLFGMVFWIMHYSIRKIGRQNTIETIRKDTV